MSCFRATTKWRKIQVCSHSELLLREFVYRKYYDSNSAIFSLKSKISLYYQNKARSIQNIFPDASSLEIFHIKNECWDTRWTSSLFTVNSGWAQPPSLSHPLVLHRLLPVKIWLEAATPAISSTAHEEENIAWKPKYFLSYVIRQAFSRELYMRTNFFLSNLPNILSYKTEKNKVLDWLRDPEIDTWN